MTEVEKAKVKVEELVKTCTQMQKELQLKTQELLKAQGVYEHELAKEKLVQPELPLEYGK